MDQLPVGEFDEKTGTYEIKRVGNWIVAVAPMIFNDRVVLTHVDEYPYTLTGGWCYDKGVAAFAAAAVWNPTVDPRPAGFKKEACFDEHTWQREKEKADG